MIVRPARNEDAPALCVILNDVVDHTTITFTTIRKTESGVAQDIAARGDAYLVAERDGQIVGLATCFPFRSGPGYARTQEHTVVLTKTARGQGTGRALMAALEDVARGQGVHSLIAGISGENLSGLAFHAAIGFVEVGRLPEVGHKFGRWLDLVLMQKRL